MLRKTVLFGLLVGLLLSFSLALPTAAQTARPVIIDTDMGSDDWMAILYLLNTPDVAVQAITVTGTGLAYCDAGVHIALGLLALADYGDVPVSCWRETPLMGENAFPAEWRTNMEAAEGLGLPAGGAAAEQDAVALFTSVVEVSAEPVTVLALGPLTNVGAALDADPSLIEKIEMIYIMGGAVDVAGSGVTEQNTTAEWNIFCDPHAARLVFESGAPVTLVPLDATNDVPVTMDFVGRLDAARQTPEAEFVYNMLVGSQGFIESGGYYFWDPLAAAVLSDESLVALQDRDVTVIDTPGPENGRTKPVGNGPEIRVATAPDAAAFEQRFIETLNG
ncbi:MAG: nucleoside hydrolase [Chloroflexi bacterium]|nr:nucleoside hydrolase [Chloroflexota bacterium]